MLRRIQRLEGIPRITAVRSAFMWPRARAAGRPHRRRRKQLGDAMKVAVLGLGYVGTVTAACLAANGHDVWGVDVDAAKVDDIRAGRSPVAEPGLDTLVARAVTGGTLHATTRSVDALDGADASLVCVGTPSTARGGTD